MRKGRIFAALVLSVPLGLSPLAAADPVIERGIDAFVTRADGRTYYDFSKNPIPAGFFCTGSQAFTGRVALKGLPLTTQTPGQLRGADTVVERLDDATFNVKGTAVTRIQFRALSLVSAAPIKTSCGAFHLHISLNGPQRVTLMSIHRTQEAGGTFVAPLSVGVRMSFVPAKSMKVKSPRKLELTGTVTFPPRPLPWSFKKAAGIRSATVDTNGDLSPDTKLPGTSNFSPGVPPELAAAEYLIGACPCEPTCHFANGEEHCYYPSDCYPVVCP